MSCTWFSSSCFYRDSVLFTDQREAGIPRFLHEPIPAASRGNPSVAHREGKPVSLERFEEGRSGPRVWVCAR